MGSNESQVNIHCLLPIFWDICGLHVDLIILFVYLVCMRYDAVHVGITLATLDPQWTTSYRIQCTQMSKNSHGLTINWTSRAASALPLTIDGQAWVRTGHHTHLTTRQALIAGVVAAFWSRTVDLDLTVTSWPDHLRHVSWWSSPVLLL